MMDEAVSHYLKGGYTEVALGVGLSRACPIDHLQADPLLPDRPGVRGEVPLPDAAAGRARRHGERAGGRRRSQRLLRPSSARDGSAVALAGGRDHDAAGRRM